MRVVHIISNLDLGGAETTLFQIVTHNKQDEHVVVSLQGGGSYGPKLEVYGAQVVCLNMPRGRVSMGGLLCLFRLIRQHRPDVVQTWMYHADLIGGVVARLAGANCVSWGIHHSNLNANANSKTVLLLVKICAVLSRVIPRKIISCSNKSTQVHIARGYAAKKFRTVSNGYDLTQFSFNNRSRTNYRTRWHVGDETLLGAVGRWHPQKDHQNLIQSLALLNANSAAKPIRCVLVGNGMSPDNAELIHLLKKYDAERYFILHGLSNDVPAMMSAIDIHVLSSKGEAFPNVVAEAMACATPCVVTDVGDAREIVATTGWLAPAENAQALADAISRGVDAATDAKKWAARRRQCVEHIAQNYEISMIVEQYRSVWAELAH